MLHADSLSPPAAEHDYAEFEDYYFNYNDDRTRENMMRSRQASSR